MPTRPGSRGSSGSLRPVRVSCRRISRAIAPQSTQGADRTDGQRRGGRAPCIRSPAMPGELPHARRLADLDEAFRTLPERYLGAPEGFDATYHVRLGDVGRTWEVRCTTHGARVRKGSHAPRARRRHRDRRADVAGPARGRAVGRRRLLAAAALRARRRRPGDRLRGPVPPAQRAPAARAHPRRAAPGPPRLDADDGRRPRRRVHPRARARPRPRSSTPRRRSRAPATASTRSTCPASAAPPSRSPARTRRAGSPTRRSR